MKNKGEDLLEYALLIALIMLIAMGVWGFVHH
jgi:uncharacterized protein (UPF0333 family)